MIHRSEEGRTLKSEETWGRNKFSMLIQVPHKVGSSAYIKGLYLTLFSLVIVSTKLQHILENWMLQNHFCNSYFLKNSYLNILGKYSPF